MTLLFVVVASLIGAGRGFVTYWQGTNWMISLLRHRPAAAGEEMPFPAPLVLDLSGIVTGILGLGAGCGLALMLCHHPNIAAVVCLTSGSLGAVWLSLFCLAGVVTPTAGCRERLASIVLPHWVVIAWVLALLIIGSWWLRR